MHFFFPKSSTTLTKCPYYEIDKATTKKFKYGKFKTLNSNKEEKIIHEYEPLSSEYFPLQAIKIAGPSKHAFGCDEVRYFKRDSEFETRWIDPSPARYDLGRYGRYWVVVDLCLNGDLKIFQF